MRGVEQSSTALTGAAGGRKAANGAHAPQAIAPGAVAEAPCLPFPPACAKGRRTLSRAGQAGLRKSSWHRRCHQGVSPAGSVGAERCPPGTSAPRRGFPLRKGPPGPFSNPFLRLPKATKAVGRCPTPCKPFEKGLSENFTCLHPAFAEGPALAERKKAACPVRSRTPSAGFPVSVSQKTPPP